MAETARDGVRDAVASDARGIARVHVDAWRETYSGILDDHHFSEDAFLRRQEFWAAHLSREGQRGRVVVAQKDGVIVGFASAGEARGTDALYGFPPARNLQLYTIYLLTAAHGTGLGQSMMEAVVGDAPAQLWVLRGNDRAIAFYKRNGFAADGTEFNDSSEPNRTEIRMVR